MNNLNYLHAPVHCILNSHCRNLRQKDVSKFHIQLSLAILCMLLASTVLIKLSHDEVSPLYGGCVTLSVTVHYFTLASVMWMGAEALLMFLKVVMVFKQVTVSHIAMVSVVCWCKLIIICEYYITISTCIHVLHNIYIYQPSAPYLSPLSFFLFLQVLHFFQ